MSVTDLTFDSAWLERIKAKLPVVEVLDTTDSTNWVCRRRFESGDKSPCLVVADQQTQGRGRLDRVWVSPPSVNLYASLLLQFPGGCSLNGLSLMVGLSFAQTLSGLGIEGLKVKWPNDLLLNGKKIAGILIEVLSAGTDPQTLVLGFGLNLFKPVDRPNIDQPWTYLAEAKPGSWDRAQILMGLVDRLLVDLGRFETFGWGGFSSIWPEYDAFLGARLKVDQSGRVFKGVGAGVDATGALLIQQSDGTQTPIVSADVSQF